ncbi:hypothetical protein [Acutalibacter sp. JLR.KK004]|uniref:hypothetical protein n=1 Tax=Acutalibacter sp. JLR.KK004 TaxID=3112622 RepID=UPI002FEE79D6
MQTLIVVYKNRDEMAINQLRKLLETDDDHEDRIVGVEDGSVEIVPWTEKVWIQNKEAGTIKSKVLLIDDIKGSDQLSPIMDIKYDKYGIIYGWAGSQALLTIDEKALKKKENYEKFLAELRTKVKNGVTKKEKKLGLNKRTVGKGLATAFLPFVWPAFAASLIKDGFDDGKIVRQQMLMLGMNELYYNHLDQFLKG